MPLVVIIFVAGMFIAYRGTEIDKKWLLQKIFKKNKRHNLTCCIPLGHISKEKLTLKMMII